MKDFEYKIFFCEDWKLKGHPKDCEFCLGMKLEKELATAKAENGRLIEVLTWCEARIVALLNFISEKVGCSWPKICNDGDHGKCPHCKIYESKGEPEWTELYSSSNALDYWQGEIRKAKIEAYQDMRFFCHTERSQLKEPRLGESVPVYEAARYGAMGELAKKCEDAIVYQSNQSKGEKGKG